MSIKNSEVMYREKGLLRDDYPIALNMKLYFIGSFRRWILGFKIMEVEVASE